METLSTWVSIKSRVRPDRTDAAPLRDSTAFSFVNWASNLPDPRARGAYHMAHAVRLGVFAHRCQQCRHVVLVDVALLPPPACAQAYASQLTLLSDPTARLCVSVQCLEKPAARPHAGIRETDAAVECRVHSTQGAFENSAARHLESVACMLCPGCGSWLRTMHMSACTRWCSPAVVGVAPAVPREGRPNVDIGDHVHGVLPAQTEELRRLAPRCQGDPGRFRPDRWLPLPDVWWPLQMNARPRSW